MTDPIEIMARAAYIAHHNNGPTEEALTEPNMGRGGFKTEIVVWRAVAQAALDALKDAAPIGAIEALSNYQQADMDGIMVLTSRQAIHEVLDFLKPMIEAAGSE